jgi:uncharacterized membrane protein
MESSNETQRIEAFSDGVFAIAITLLVLELMPVVNNALNTQSTPSLFGAIASHWPMFLAFATSFATIGIMWMNHHRLYNIITRSNHILLILNLLLLFAVTFIPFPTAMLGERWDEPVIRQEATIIYCATFLAAAIFFNILWRYVTYRGHLLDQDVNMQAVKRIDRQYLGGPVFYGIAFILAWFNPTLALALNALLALFFLLPGFELRPTPTHKSEHVPTSQESS